MNKLVAINLVYRQVGCQRAYFEANVAVADALAVQHGFTAWPSDRPAWAWIMASC